MAGYNNDESLCFIFIELNLKCGSAGFGPTSASLDVFFLCLAALDKIFGLVHMYSVSVLVYTGISEGKWLTGVFTHVFIGFFFFTFV